MDAIPSKQPFIIVIFFSFLLTDVLMFILSGGVIGGYTMLRDKKNCVYLVVMREEGLCAAAAM